MADDARVPVLIAAQAAALSARTGGLAGPQVADLLRQAYDLLDPGDDLRQAILSFASRYNDLRRDAYAVRLLGEELEAALRVALNLENPQTGLKHPGYRDDE